MLKLILPVILIFFTYDCYSQDSNQQDSIEVFIIENYVTPEVPNTFMLTFFTDRKVKSKIIIDDEYDYVVSDNLVETHKAEIDISKLNFRYNFVPFTITMEDSLGNVFKSEGYEIEMPKEIKVEGGSSFLLFCLFGGIVFALPSPAYVIEKDDSYFSLTKEVPLLFIRSSGYNYPLSYFSVEYSHIFDAPIRNFFRVGYKHIFETPGIKYISPGINGFTNFKGFNGISPELSLGLFRIYNTFTVYARYRFNAKPGDVGSEFHEFSIGLYSGFFAIYIN